MLVNKGHWFLILTVDAFLQCPTSVDQNSHWGEAHHAIVSTRNLYGILAIFWLSTKCRPTIDRVLTNYRTDTSVKYLRTIGEVSVKYRWTKREKLYRPRHIWNDHRPCLDWVSSDYRLNLDRLSTAISTESRPTIDCYIDRVLTDYRPSVDLLSTAISTKCRPTIDRYIDR